MTVGMRLLRCVLRVLTFLAFALAAVTLVAVVLDIEQLPASVAMLVVAVYAVASLRKMNASLVVERSSGSNIAGDASVHPESDGKPPQAPERHAMRGSSDISKLEEDEEARAREKAKRLIERHRVTLLGFGIVASFFLEYTWYTRTFSERMPAMILGALVSLCVHLVLAYRARLRDVRSLLWAVAAGVALGPFAGMSCYGLFAALSDASNLIIHSAPAAHAALVLVAGICLYAARRWVRAVYGLTEVALGVFIGGQKLAGPATDSLDWSLEIAIATLTAGIYLVVRGLDNIEQGVSKPPRDALWTALGGSYLGWAINTSERLKRELIEKG